MVLAAVRRGAFFGALSDRLAENREYTRKTSDAMQEYLWTAGLNRRNEVKKARTALQSAFDYVTSKGLEEKSALFLLDRSPTELIRMAKAAEKAELEGTLDSTKLNQTMESYGNALNDFDISGVTAEDLIKDATPDFKKGADLDLPEDDRNFLQKMFMAPDRQSIMSDVYRSEIMGQKGADIAASISEPTIKTTDPGKARITADLTAFTDPFGAGTKRDLTNQVQNKYDKFLDNLIKEADKEIRKAESGTEEEKTLAEENYNAALRIKNMEDEQKYIELVRLYPQIAYNFYNQADAFKSTFSDPAYFSPTILEIIKQYEPEE